MICLILSDTVMIPYHKTVSGTPVGPLLYRVRIQSGVPYHPSKTYQKKNASIYIDTASIRLRYASDTRDIAWIPVQETKTICTGNQACPPLTERLKTLRPGHIPHPTPQAPAGQIFFEISGAKTSKSLKKSRAVRAMDRPMTLKIEIWPQIVK